MAMPARPKIATCVNCRQMKVKCDAKEVFPAPCSRCSKHQLSCFINPSFQRTAKRKWAEQLERELREIKTAAHASPATTTRGGVRHGSTASPVEFTQIPAAAVSTSTYPEYSSAIHSSAFETQKIGDVELSPYTITEILDCFFTLYHHDFPILPDPSVFVRGYYRCPLLFWVVVAIASKSMEQYAQLYVQLEPHVRLLATNIEAVPDHPLGTVQALLLLCWWPFPFQATRNDPSWMYSGLAVHIGLRFGLHRPHHFSDFVYSDCLDENGIQAFQKSWVGCFIINQTLGSELGVPSTVSPDTTILSALNGQMPRLPKVLEQHLKIAYQSYNICHTLGNNESTTSGLLPSALSVIKVFDRGFKELDTQLSTDLSPYTKMALLRVKLQLYSFALTDDIVDRHDIRVANRTAEYLSRAGHDAMQLIAIASEHAHSLSSQQPWPAIARASVVYASHFLLRLLACSEYLDIELAKNSVGQAWMLLNSRSELENDSWARICEIISYLSRAGSEQSVPAFMPVRARMSANVMVDSVWRARERFSEDIRREKPSDYTAAEAVKDILQFGFDLLVGSEFSEESGPIIM